MGGRRFGDGEWRGFLVAALLALSAPAVAQAPARGEGGESAPWVRVFGRAFARVSTDEREDFARTLNIPSARLGVGASLGNVDAEVTADLASKNLLKDAFIRVADDAKRYRLYGGQFKAPFLARELESTWGLPLIKRGLVDDYLLKTHQLGGRRLGLMGEVQLKGAWDFKALAGVFQGAKDEQLGTRAGEDASARVAVRPLKILRVGMSAYLTQAFAGVKNYAGAVDAIVLFKRLRVSAEAAAGRLGVGPFTAQLGLVSYFLPLGQSPWALEPLVSAEALQLRGDVQGQGHALTSGVNVHFSEHFKTQLQAEWALRPGDETPGLEVALQLAARF